MRSILGAKDPPALSFQIPRVSVLSFAIKKPSIPQITDASRRMWKESKPSALLNSQLIRHDILERRVVIRGGIKWRALVKGSEKRLRKPHFQAQNYLTGRS